MRVRLLDATAQTLPAGFRDANYQFKSVALQGTKSEKPRWQRGVDTVNNAMGEAIGQLYVSQYFPPAYKARMVELVDNLLKTYSMSIDNLTWMSPATKVEAHAKLAKYGVKIGYPDVWRDYRRLEVKAGDPIGNGHARRAVRIPPPGRAQRQAGRPHRVGHDAADGQRVLRPDQERDRVPGRHPAAAVLRHGGRRRGQLRRHRRGHRPRDQPRLRRPGQPVRRRRQAAQLVDAGGPQGLRRDHVQLDAQYSAYEPLPGTAPERQADDGREHRRPVGPADRLQGLEDVAGRQAVAGHRRPDRRAALLLRLLAGVARARCATATRCNWW